METAWEGADSILDLCVSAIREQGKTVEDCLDRYEGQVENLEPLLRLTVRLQSAQAIKASPAFRRTAEDRLRKFAPTIPRARLSGRALPGFLGRSRLHQKSGPLTARAGLTVRFLLASAILALLILSGTGALAASAQALPGDFLYPVKRANEAIQLSFTLNEAGQARLRLEQVDRRMNEAVASWEENRPAALNQALADYNEQMKAEMGYFGSASRLTPDEQAGLANDLLSDLNGHQADLASITKDAPPSAQSALDSAITISHIASNQAEQIINQGGGKAIPGGTFSPTPIPPAGTLAPALSVSATPQPYPPGIRPSIAAGKPTARPTGRPGGNTGPTASQPPVIATQRPTIRPGGTRPPGVLPTLGSTLPPSWTPHVVRTPIRQKTAPPAFTPPATMVPLTPWPTIFHGITPPGSILPISPINSPTPGPTNTPGSSGASVPAQPSITPAAWARPNGWAFSFLHISQPAGRQAAPVFVQHRRKGR